MIRFYGEELLTPRPTPKLEDHPLSFVRDCFFNIFAATFHIGGRFSFRNLRTRHAVVTGTHLSRSCPYIFIKCNTVNCSSRNCQICLSPLKLFFSGLRENSADGRQHSEMHQQRDLNPLRKVVNFRSFTLDISLVEEGPQRKWLSWTSYLWFRASCLIVK